MDGVHDMGGMHGFGSVPVDADGAFHADWERAVFALNRLAGVHGWYALDEKRHALERMPPAEYLGSSYFERWLVFLEDLLVEEGVATEGELRARAEAIAGGDASVPERMDQSLATRVREAFEADRFSDRTPVEPRYAAGDDVVVTNRHTGGHTRVPRYARRARGVVRKHYGTFAVPDEVAHGRDGAEPVYSVRFDAAELWDGDTDGDVVHVDMWERYLESPDGG